MKKIIFALMLALLPTVGWAVAAPTGLSATAVASASSTLSWVEDTTVNQWFIYLDGVLRYQPQRSETTVPSAGRRGYFMSSLPAQATIVVTMRANTFGQPYSVLSSALTITSSTVPFTYVQNAPGTFLMISGSAGGGGGDATAANQVLGNASLSSIDGKLTSGVTVNTHAVTQGGPFTVSGSVTTLPAGAAQAVSVLTSVLPTGASTSALQTTGNTSASLSAGFLTGSAATSALQTTGNTNTSNIFAALSSTGAASQQVQGNVANGATDAGNPLKVGGIGRTTLPTAVTDGQRVNATYDKFGRLMTLFGAPRELVSQNTVTLASTTETTILTAIASTFLDLTNVFVISTGNQDVRIDFRDTTGGTVMFSMYFPTGNPGVAIPITVPITQTTVNTNWTAQLSTSAGTTSVRIFIQAIKNK